VHYQIIGQLRDIKPSQASRDPLAQRPGDFTGMGVEQDRPEHYSIVASAVIVAVHGFAAIRALPSVTAGRAAPRADLPN
jgi:hypothetical protein